MSGPDVIDLCASGSDDEELPSFASLTQRFLARKGASAPQCAAAAPGGCQPTRAAAASQPDDRRRPLSPPNHAALGSPGTSLLGKRKEPAAMHADADRPQYHQQEHRQQQQPADKPPSQPKPPSSAGPRRGKRTVAAAARPWAQLSPGGAGGGDDGDEDYQPFDEEDGSQLFGSSQPWGGGSQQFGGWGGSQQFGGGSGSQQAAAKKARKPRRTKEEKERDDALKAQERAARKLQQERAKAEKQLAQQAERADKKRLREAASKAHCLQQVRLVVDTALMSSGGGGKGGGGGGSGGAGGGAAGGGSLGVALLRHLDEHNQAHSAASKKERIVNYVVAPLDLALFKALRWQRRRLVAAAEGGSQAFGSQALGSQFGGSQFASSQHQQQPGWLPPSQQQQQQGLGPGGAAGAGLDTQGSGSSSLAEQWEEEPSVMILFQPQEFIDAVQRDRLASLFSLLERRAPGHRPLLTVVGLAAHIQRTERRQHQADMRAGQASVREVVANFVTELAVECPRLGFRDVVDAAQAAQHVQLLTRSIAELPHQDSEATAFLRAHDKSVATGMQNLLINHPLEGRDLEPTAYCLAALPSVIPGIAHTLADNYQSLGGLMGMLLQPGRSDKDKEAELADLRIVKPANRRVGNVAARQLLTLLRSEDPDLKVKQDEAEAAAAEEKGGRGRKAGGGQRCGSGA